MYLDIIALIIVAIYILMNSLNKEDKRHIFNSFYFNNTPIYFFIDVKTSDMLQFSVNVMDDEFNSRYETVDYLRYYHNALSGISLENVVITGKRTTVSPSKLTIGFKIECEYGWKGPKCDNGMQHHIEYYYLCVTWILADFAILLFSLTMQILHYIIILVIYKNVYALILKGHDVTIINSY